MASTPKTLASGTTDVAIHTGPGRLVGLLITQVTAASPLTLYDNTSAAGLIVFSGTVPVGTTFYPMPDVLLNAGLFADRDATNAQAITAYLGQ